MDLVAILYTDVPPSGANKQVGEGVSPVCLFQEFSKIEEQW